MHKHKCTFPKAYCTDKDSFAWVVLYLQWFAGVAVKPKGFRKSYDLPFALILKFFYYIKFKSKEKKV